MADDPAPGPFLRLHLVDGDQIDLDEIPDMNDLAFRLSGPTTVGDYTAGQPALVGTHAGGNRCVVPVASILWAEAIE